jgi:glycine hydroxymethyltransferase
MNPNGIRIGTPSVTTRGMKEREMEIIANLISRVIKEKEASFKEVKAEVKKLTQAYPLYKGVFSV